MRAAIAVILGGLLFLGCSTESPVKPDSSSQVVPTRSVSNAASAVNTTTIETAKGGPGYEPAYYNGGVVTINAIDVPQNPGPLAHATADFYEVVYPANHALWPAGGPMCNPCDHEGNGIDPTDFHDHLLD